MKFGLVTLLVLHVLPYFLNLNWIKPWLLPYLARRYHLNVDYSFGRLALLPKPGIVVSGLVVSKPDGSTFRLSRLSIALRPVEYWLAGELALEGTVEIDHRRRGRSIEGTTSFVAGIARAVPSNGGSVGRYFHGRVNADNLYVDLNRAFVKPMGTIARIDLRGNRTEDGWNVEAFSLSLADLVAEGTAAFGSVARLTLKLPTSSLFSLGAVAPLHSDLLSEAFGNAELEIGGELRAGTGWHGRLNAALSGSHGALAVNARLESLSPARFRVFATARDIDVGLFQKSHSPSPASIPRPRVNPLAIDFRAYRRLADPAILNAVDRLRDSGRETPGLGPVLPASGEVRLEWDRLYWQGTLLGSGTMTVTAEPGDHFGLRAECKCLEGTMAARASLMRNTPAYALSGSLLLSRVNGGLIRNKYLNDTFSGDVTFSSEAGAVRDLGKSLRWIVRPEGKNAGG